MQTITEVVDSGQVEVLLQAFQKQVPRRGISTVGASSPPPIARIRDMRGITPTAKLAMLLLHARAPNIYPGMKLLAADMGTSVRTAQRAVRELESAGYVRAMPRIGQTNLYALTLPLASMPPPSQDVTPPLTPVSPPPDMGVTPPLTPVSPEVSREVFNESNKREREGKLTHSRSTNHIRKETLTCPACERSWAAASGSICFDCNMEVSTIQRNIEARKSQDEAWKAERQKREDAQIKELGINRQKQDVQRKEAETCTQEQRAEQPKESPVEVEAGLQKNRKKLFDVLGKQYDTAILKHFPQGGE